MKKTVSIFTHSTGHYSIALAAKQAFPSNQYRVHINQKNNEFFNLYRPIYLYMPGVNKIPFAISKSDRAQNILTQFNLLTNQKYVTQILKKQKPNIVINTHFFYNSLITSLNAHNNYTPINIVTDPRSISPVIPAPSIPNLVFDSEAVNICRKLGIKKKNLIPSGWLVRDEFEQPYDQANVRHSLKIPANQLTILIVGGAEGTNHILKALPAFLNLPQPTQLIFACGNNKGLYKTIRALAKVANSTSNSQVTLTPLRFTKDIHKYIQASDLVIGKAGPNLLFESVATHTPFLAITHIAGQEDGNLDIIREHNLGFVEENILRLPRLLKEITSNPQVLHDLEPSLQKMATYNQSSKSILLELAESNSNI